MADITKPTRYLRRVLSDMHAWRQGCWGWGAEGPRTPQPHSARVPRGPGVLGPPASIYHPESFPRRRLPPKGSQSFSRMWYHSPHQTKGSWPEVCSPPRQPALREPQDDPYALCPFPVCLWLPWSCGAGKTCQDASLLLIQIFHILFFSSFVNGEVSFLHKMVLPTLKSCVWG